MTSDQLDGLSGCPGDLSHGVGIRPPELCAIQHAIFENAGRAIILTDVTGVIFYFNQMAQRMLGYAWDDVVFKATPMLFHLPEEVERRARLLSEELRRDISPGFETFVAGLSVRPHEDGEWTYVRKDGKQLPVSLSVSALHDEHGMVCGYLGIAADISRRRAMEEELRIAAIAFASQAAIMVTDARQQILRVQPGIY